MVTFCRRLTTHPAFEYTILGVILLAAVVVGLETSRQIMDRWGGLLHTLDKLIIGIFVTEIAVKMLAHGRRPWRYFYSGWNIFDFTIVAVSLLPAAGAWVAVARLARVLRALRLVSAVPRLQLLVLALLRSLPSMGYVCILLFLHFYIYAVLGVFFFRDNDPTHFGTLGDALLSLFRIVTLEDWTDIMYAAIYGTQTYPVLGPVATGPEPQAFGWLAVLYFVSFVAVGAMVIINLLVGVMVSSISEAQAERLRERLHLAHAPDSRDAAILRSVENLEREVAALREQLDPSSKP